MVAELVLTGGAVYTVDSARRWAEAVAVQSGRIIAVGTEAEIRPLIGPRTRVVELGGRMVLPGFQDAHLHPALGGRADAQCPLDGAADGQAYLTLVARYAAEHPEASWIVGRGWAMDVFPGGTPDKASLDAVVPGRPVFLKNRDGHLAWVNSAALKASGVGRGTLDPSDGRIERDAGGEPSGTLHEGAMALVERHIPPATQAEWEEAIGRAQAHLHSQGITAWQDAAVTPQMLAAYRALAGRGELTARVIAALTWDRERGEAQVTDLLARRSWGTLGRLRATTVKIFQDGLLGNRTAALLEPYCDASDRSSTERGISLIEAEALKRYVTRLDREGFQVHVHAIGDRATREALDAFETARRANGRHDLRHHIAHAILVDQADVPRFKALDVTATVQPFWAFDSRHRQALTRPALGPARTERLYPFQSLRRAGASIAFGSDWPVSTASPLLAIEVAVTRVDPDDRRGAPFLSYERLDMPEAIAASTIGSAYVNHLDHETGIIEAGKLADLIVLDRNLFDADGGPIGEARVLLTLIEGVVVHADSSAGWLPASLGVT